MNSEYREKRNIAGIHPEQNRIYDPDYLSVLFEVLAVLANLGGATGLVMLAYAVNDRVKSDREMKHKEQIDSKLKEIVFRDISRQLRKCFFAVKYIRNDLKTLRAIAAHSINTPEVTARMAEFGNDALYLTKKDFQLFYQKKDSICSQISVIHSAVRGIEESLSSEYLQNDVEDVHFAREHRYQMAEFFYRMNYLMEDFGKVSLDEFCYRTSKLCDDLEEEMMKVLKKLPLTEDYE